jgi:hypothetical protein
MSPDPEPSSEPPAAPAWSTWTQAVVLILTGATMRTAMPVAAVVGTLLCLLNQGGALLAGDIDTTTALRMVGNYAIPYLVSSVGFLAAHRTSRRTR